MRPFILAAALALSATLASCASPPEGPTGRDCFRAEDVNGFSIFDDHNVKVNVGATRGYLLGTPQNIRELDWTQQIALHADSGWICVGNGLGVEIVGGGTIPRRYQVRSVTPAPAEGS